MVYLQRDNRGASRCGKSKQFDAGFIPDKMFRPYLAAWVKESSCQPAQWINRADLAAFEFIAKTTSETQIFKDCQAALSARQNVVNRHRLAGVGLFGAAVSAVAIIGLRQAALQVLREVNAHNF
jgi:hypothetical protein